MEDFKEEIHSLRSKYRGTGCFLAGGAITSKFTGAKVNDYDLYFRDKPHFMEAVACAYEDRMWCVSCTDRSITFVEGEDVFQFMLFDWFPTSEAIFERFDFTCVMAAIDLDTGEFFRHPDFLRNVSKRTLEFNHKTKFPIGSHMRVRKYQTRGYTMADFEYLKVAIACALTPVDSWQELRRQIGGQYGRCLKMDTSKPFNLDNAIESLNAAVSREIRYDEAKTPGDFAAAMECIYGEQFALEANAVLEAEPVNLVGEFTKLCKEERS